MEPKACPECGQRGYLILPSRSNCQTCLRLRAEYLDKSVPKGSIDE
jgi:hypothetical protein